MPIDAHIGGFLAALAQSGSPRVTEVPPEAARVMIGRLAQAVRPSGNPLQVHAVEEATIPVADATIPARIYRPSSARDLPTVVYFHGGGFVVGDLDSYDSICRELCRGTDAVVVSVGYRLAPEYPYPTPVNDGIAATRWALENAGKLGGSNIVAVAGDSAGGSIAASVTQALRDEDIALAAQLLVYPAVARDHEEFASYRENGSGYFLEIDTVDWFDGHHAPEGVDRASPLFAPLSAKTFAGLPPAVVLTAEYDPLRDEGEAYGRALAKAGVPTRVIRCDGMLHGFYDMGDISPGARAWIDQSIGAFRALLDGAKRT